MHPYKVEGKGTEHAIFMRDGCVHSPPSPIYTLAARPNFLTREEEKEEEEGTEERKEKKALLCFSVTLQSK